MCDKFLWYWDSGLFQTEWGGGLLCVDSILTVSDILGHIGHILDVYHGEQLQYVS